MSKKDDRFIDTDELEIHIPEYDPNYSNIRDIPNDDGRNLNYFQRMELEKARRAQSADPRTYNDDRYAYEDHRNYGDRSDYEDRYAYEDRRAYEDRQPYDSDYDEPIGDTYDFGRAPRSRARKSNRDYDDYNDHDRTPHHKKRRKRHPFLRFLLKLIVFLGILLAILLLIVHILFSKMTRVDPVADTSADQITKSAGVTPYSEVGVMNILLIGQDARTGETQTRSDTMIICSLNMKTRQITLTSLMRDMYVPIAEYGSDKLNAAYVLGGMETLDATVQENFGIDIDGNAVVDLEGFLTALTSIGNLDIELTAEEAQYLNENPGIGSADDSVWENWSLTAGVNSMTPAQVLAYSRMRYVGNSDWDRTNRQKKVIQTAFAQLKSNPSKILSVINDAAPSITTDMNDLYLLRAMFLALICGTDMDTYTIPGDSGYYADTINGQSVLVPDLEECSSRLRSYIYGGNGSASNHSATEDNTENTTEIPAGTTDTYTEITENESETYDGPLIDYDGDGTYDGHDADGDGYPDEWGDSW